MQMGQNCYVVYGQNEAIIIDPIDNDVQVLDFLKQNDLKVVGIVNTHGHFDHITGNVWFKEQTGAPIMIHEADQAFLYNHNLNLSELIGVSIKASKADQILIDGSEITIGDEKLTVLHTPGHTPGCICLYSEGILISGDTLFKQSIGRTDLPGSNFEQLIASLEKIKQLPQDTKIYPGHGESTTLAAELQNNPYLQKK